MTSKRTLGIFFGNQSFSLVESDNQTPQKFLYFPYNTAPENTPGPKTPDDLKMTEALQKALRDLKISAKEINLSLPAKDIIFRSFVIPFMNPNEIKGVVDFESRKYIPFKLNELSYTYHPITIQENTNKQIRILFAAIKNDILENYCTLVEIAGLQVNLIEPSSVSLIRALTFKKLIPKDQTIALVQADGKEGKIIIVEQGAMQFVRDFQLTQSLAQRREGDVQTFQAKLFNEIRISLDYYTRQSGQEKIHGITAIKTPDGFDFTKNLEKDLGVPVTVTSAKEILNQPTDLHPDLISALGIGLRHSVVLNANFDLNRKVVKPVKPAPLTKEKVAVNIKSLAVVFSICLVLLGATFFLSKGLVTGLQKKLTGLSEQQGIFESLTKEQIEQKIKETQDKLEEYKSVRMQSEVIYFLSLIPKFLPEGAWLRDLTIKYTEVPTKTDETGRVAADSKTVSKMSIDLNGFAFLENSNQQIRLVRSLVSDLKQNEGFAKTFATIDLVTAQSQMLEDFPVTVYRIECK